MTTAHARPVDGVSSLFSSRQHQHYLDTACMGLVSEPVRQSVLDYTRRVTSGTPPLSATDESVALLRQADRCRQAVADLIQCQPEEVALVESTTHGLRIAAATIPLAAGDNIIIGDMEFLGLVTPWLNRCQMLGVEIRTARSDAGRLTVDSYRAAADCRTQAIIVSAVQETNGYRANIAGLSELCEQYGALLIVDGIQEAGALAVDVTALPIDMYCCGGHKWLGSPFGLGFMYVRSELCAQLVPDAYGYMAITEPDMGWKAYLEWPQRSPFEKFAFTDAARKLECGGNSNFPGLIALLTSAELLVSIGRDVIERRVLGLARRLTEGLQRSGISLCPGVSEPPQSGIVVFNLPGGLEQERQLVEQATRENVFVSLRYVSGIGGIRVSPHVYNDEQDIDCLLELVESGVR